jgi:hypothetical protein
MSNISSIDDLLAGVGNSQQAATPEHKDKLEKQIEEKAPVEEIEPETPSYDDEPEEKLEAETPDDEPEDEQNPEPEDVKDELDEYGNKKELMSRHMKERLEKKEKEHRREIEQRDFELQQLRQQLSNQGASKEVQQAVKDFKFDPKDDTGWEQQLSEFVKATVQNMNVEQQHKERQVQEQRIEREFSQKFTKGMERFGDFREIVGKQPIDDAMTLSLRGMADPAAFIYAASKRNPQELERISKLADPYARMVEMGKLEERMRRNKTTTKTPKPLGRPREDATTKAPVKERDTSGDDLLAKADAKRLATVRNRHKGNR